MTNTQEESPRKKIIFLTSSFVNIARLFAENNPDFDVFLILDRKFPFEMQEFDNFYVFTFNKNKVFDANINKYFDMLGVFIDDFNPDFVVLNNFTKILSKSFIDFMKFRNSNLKLINIHHGDLRVIDEIGKRRFDGMSGDIKQMLDEAMIISTIFNIDNNNNFDVSNVMYTSETTLKELKQKGFVKKKEDIFNLRLRNVILSYHERTKVLRVLRKFIDEFC